MSDSSKTETNMVKLTIDGREISVPKGTTVYHAVKKLGIDLPIFCYQDRMPPFGACRVCMVEVEKMGKTQTSCTLEATEGMVVHTQSEKAVQSRQEILEFLLINHPLDCPICDKGGECPLQDQTMEFGPGESRFYEEKRHFKKPVFLGPVLTLDRERCIACARCTRFSEIVAGDNALEFIERGYKTEVGTPDDGPAKSKYIGNTISICPVGALTSRVYRFRARPWDNKQTESACTLCPVGCSMTIDSRDGEVMRTRACENREVNDIWMCDKGWFGYEFVDSEQRLRQPLIRKGDAFEPTSWDHALTVVAEQMEKVRSNGKIAGLGGNPLTVEENYLFQRLMRECLNTPHVDHRVGMSIINLDEEGLPPGIEIGLKECEELSQAILLGVNLTEEFPVIWLRLKQAINNGARVDYYGHFAPEISRHLSSVTLHAPGQEISHIDKLIQKIKAEAKQTQTAIFIGAQYLHSPFRKLILSKLLQLRQEIPNLTLNLLEGIDNSLGARFAGMHPELDSLNERLPERGMNVLEILNSASSSGWGLLYIAGANPAVQYPSSLWNSVRKKLDFLVVQDLFLTETAQQADVVLPTLSFMEKRGSFLNIEGRFQRLNPGKMIPEEIYSDGEIFIQLAQKLQSTLTFDQLFLDTIKRGKIPFSRPESVEGVIKTTELPKNGLAVSFSRMLFDKGVRMQHNPHLLGLAPIPTVRIHPNDGKKLNVQSGSTVKLQMEKNSIEGILKLDTTVAEGTVVVPLGFSELAVHELAENLINGLRIKLT